MKAVKAWCRERIAAAKRAWREWYGNELARSRRRIREDARRYGGVAYFPGDNQ